MKTINYQYIGPVDTVLSASDADATVHELTSEHDDSVTVLIVAGKFGPTGLKLPIVHQEMLYLAVFLANYALICSLESLNVKELIFMIDNEKVEFCDTPFQFDIGQFF